MKIAFLADSGLIHGAGHTLRCLAIAEEARKRSYQIDWFIGESTIPWVQELLTDGGWHIHKLHPESQYLAQQIIETTPDVLILDSYCIAPEVIANLSAKGVFITVLLDDATPLYEADLYIAPGFATKRSNSLPRSRVLVGPDFVLLRDSVREVSNLPSEMLTKSVDQPLHVVCLFGGSDPEGAAAQVLRAAASSGIQMKIEILPSSSELIKIASEAPIGIQVIVHAPSRLALQSSIRADVVISAAGVSSWELLYLGVDLALVQIAPNQEPNYREMTSRNWAHGLGVAPDWTSISAAIRSWLHSRNLNRTQKLRLPRGADGLGAQRALDEIQRRLDSTSQ